MAIGDKLAYSQFLTTDTVPTWAPIATGGFFQAQTDMFRAQTHFLDNQSGLNCFGMSMPSLPAFDIAQFSMQQCQNQWNQQGMNFGSFNWSNFNSPFTFNPGGGSSSSSSSGSGKTEFETAKDFLNKILTLAKDSKSGVKIKPALKAAIDEALKAKGSEDEKLEAMQEVINKIPDGIKTKVIYAMNAEELSSMGYEFKNSEDKDIKNLASNLHDKYTNNLKPDTCTSGEVEALCSKISADGSTKVLAAISHWNTKYNSDGCILGDIVKKLNVSDFKDEDKKETLLNKQIKPLVNVMLSAAQEEIENLKNDGYDVSDLESKREALNNANNALSKTAFNQANFNSLVDAFKNMYAALRINLASKMDKDIQDQYGFLNTNKKTNFKEHLILDKTKEDLAAEGVSASGITPGERTEDPDEEFDEDEFSDGEDIESDLEILTSTDGGKTPSLVKKNAGTETYYETKEGPAGAKRYYYKDGNTIKEIKNAKDVDASGNITFQDGTKKTLTEYKSAHYSAKSVTPEVIKETNKSLKKLATLIKEERLEEVPTHGKGKVFHVKNKLHSSDKQEHYYTINDEGKLCEIRDKEHSDAEVSDFTGDKIKVKDGSNTEEKAYPTDFDLVEVRDSDIRTKVKKASEVTPTTLQELQDLGGTQVSGTKNGCTITCWKCNGKYYLEGPNGSLKEVTGFTESGAAPADGSGDSGRFQWN